MTCNSSIFRDVNNQKDDLTLDTDHYVALYSKYKYERPQKNLMNRVAETLLAKEALRVTCKLTTRTHAY